MVKTLRKIQTMNTPSVDFAQRNIAIDILRALTMLLMIFVNDLWTISGEPDWLGHAESHQDFLGLADVVFPCFLFVVGMSIPFAVERRFLKGKPGVSTVGHILLRSFALLVMGVFTVNTEAGIDPDSRLTPATYRIAMVIAFFLIWNDYPKKEKPFINYLHIALKVAGIALLLCLAFTFRDGDGGIFRARWWGILGLIGWTYFLCACIYLFTRDRLQYLIPVWLVLIALCILKSGRINGEPLWGLPSGNFLDELLAVFHTGNGALPAITMGGVLLSLLSVKYINLGNRKKIVFAALTVALLVVAGFISHQYWIVSKIQATPPWVFYCSAIAVAAYSILYWLVEKGKAHWFSIIKVAGTATLTCYLMPYIAYSIATIFGIRLPEILRTGLTGIGSCIAFAFLMIGITWLLERIHIKLKI
jgi:predicted acyltransferase